MPDEEIGRSLRAIVRADRVGELIGSFLEEASDEQLTAAFGRLSRDRRTKVIASALHTSKESADAWLAWRQYLVDRFDLLQKAFDGRAE